MFVDSLDGIGFSRLTMKRVRVVMDASLTERPGGRRLVDVHGGNSFPEAAKGNAYPPSIGLDTPCSDGCASAALRFMQHFPYCDATMMGEGFNYDAPADYWLIEISSLAWGIGNDMCCGLPGVSTNAWRGMVFGMVTRFDVGETDAYGMRTNHPADKVEMWEMWDKFDMEGATMIGYWHPTPLVNVTAHDDTSNCTEVYATTYLHKGDRALVALGSWQPAGPAAQNCSLEVDWAGLGFRTSTVEAPALSGFQGGARFGVAAPVAIPAGKGALLLLTKDPVSSTDAGRTV